VDAADAAVRFADEWQRAWREHDVERAAALYADGSVFWAHPFRPPVVPSDHAGAIFGAEEPGADIRFAPGPAADGRAAVEWWARVSRGGEQVTYSGVSLLRFDELGLVIEERSYWHKAETWREPAPSWGG